jgi:hypothetical protein
MVVWLDNFWGWVSLASEISRLTACPVHCSGSCIPWLITGLLLGFLVATCIFGLFLLWWSLDLDFRPSHRFARPARVPVRPRLARYLDE